MDDTKKERSFLYRLWMDMVGDKKQGEDSGGPSPEADETDHGTDLSPDHVNIDIMDIVDRCCSDIIRIQRDYLGITGTVTYPDNQLLELTGRFAEMIFYGEPPSKSCIKFLIQIQERTEEYLRVRKTGVEPESLDARIYLNYTTDKMKAWIFAFPPVNGGNGLTGELVKEVFDQHGIVYGIDQLFIEQVAQGSRYFELCLAAKGQPAIDGREGRVIDYYPRLERSVYERTKDKFTNYKQLTWLHYITAGGLICEITPCINSTDGIDVTGNIVKGSRIKESKLPNGLNTKLIDHGTKLVAETDGTLYFENQKFHIKKVQKILPEVNITVGNIITTGDLEIKGDVFSGFIIKTTGNIKIHGMVGNSVITTEGSIEVGLGVRGCKEAVLDAGGDIRCGYIENCTVRCKGTIEARSIINCDVISDSQIKVQTLIGGNVTALQQISVETIGNAQHKKIVLNLGYTQEEFLEKTELEKKIADISAAMEPLRKNIMFLQNGNRKTMRDWSMHEELSVEYARLEAEKNQAELRLREIGEGSDQFTQCDLTASLIYPPAVINSRNEVVMIDQERSMYSIRYGQGGTKIS